MIQQMNLNKFLSLLKSKGATDQKLAQVYGLYNKKQYLLRQDLLHGWILGEDNLALHAIDEKSIEESFLGSLNLDENDLESCKEYVPPLSYDD